VAGSSCQAGWGKMVQRWLWARHGFYRRRSLSKLAHAQESLVGVELPFLKKWGLRIKWPPIHKMMTLLFYHSPIFSLIMMGVGTEDQELGQSVGLLATSCCPGALNGAGSSGSCGILVGALTAVLWTVLERLVSLEVQLVKLLISNSRHVVWYKRRSLRIGEQET
jgi:hypothetical protein